MPSIPWNNLPKLKTVAPEFYEPLLAHTSYTKMVTANGYGAVVWSGDRLADGYPHLYQEYSAGVVTPDLLFDSYFGVTDEGGTGAWMTDTTKVTLNSALSIATATHRTLRRRLPEGAEPAPVESKAGGQVVGGGSTAATRGGDGGAGWVPAAPGQGFDGGARAIGGPVAGTTKVASKAPRAGPFGLAAVPAWRPATSQGAVPGRPDVRARSSVAPNATAVLGSPRRLTTTPGKDWLTISSTRGIRLAPPVRKMAANERPPSPASSMLRRNASTLSRR